jgi:PHP family Zn ribbon phosphoesterase
MTPKEKAKELTYRFYRIIPLDKMTIDYNLAKKCALIAVDEIMEQLLKNLSNDISGIHAIYWEEVKQEIEKL